MAPARQTRTKFYFLFVRMVPPCAKPWGSNAKCYVSSSSSAAWPAPELDDDAAARGRFATGTHNTKNKSRCAMCQARLADALTCMWTFTQCTRLADASAIHCQHTTTIDVLPTPLAEQARLRTLTLDRRWRRLEATRQRETRVQAQGAKECSMSPVDASTQ